ncbi:MAG: FAD-dependent oxidoreductase [Acetobacteraceae bacterium]
MTERVDAVCDVLVLGSGAGGLAAAITARKLGLQVIVLEKEKWIGGTSALSGGWLWIPCNSLARRAGVADTLDAAREYLRHELGNRYDATRVDAFLDAGPAMIDFFERETEVRFIVGTSYPDYHPDAPGALPGGRAVCALPFDGRALGSRLAELRPPVREMTLFGLKVGSGPDFAHFANATRSLRSALYVTGRIAAHLRDVALHGRDLRLMSGNALIARLARSAFDLEIPIWLESPATELLHEDGIVTGAIAARRGREIRIAARRGVICAAGGFPHDPLRRSRLFPHAPKEAEHLSLTPAGNTGDALRMAESIGAIMEDSVASAAAWMPVSRVPYRDGSFGTFPHSFDRGKPGVIAVTASGRRFVNESDSYHDVVAAMIAVRVPGQAAGAFLVCDHRFIRRYGLGIAKPFPIPLGGYLRTGYIKRGRTVEELAARTGIDGATLAATVTRFNHHARQGHDPEFRRGENAYNRYQGDARHRPNPCLAPIETPPFYAVRILPGDLGTFAGLRTDASARVLDRNGCAIAGLYAVGTDMASVFSGAYPGPGANLGPAMTFGFIAAHDLAKATMPRRQAAKTTAAD